MTERDMVPDCPATPNCVSSLASDPARLVEPLDARGMDPRRAMEALLRVLEGQPRVEVVSRQGEHLVRAVSVSRLFGFRDDLEFVLDPEDGVVHLRSASRIGYWDLGVNRRRVERIRRAFGREMAGGGAAGR